MHTADVAARPKYPVTHWADKNMIAANLARALRKTREFFRACRAQERIVHQAAAKRMEQPIDGYLLHEGSGRSIEAIRRKDDHPARRETALEHFAVTG